MSDKKLKFLIAATILLLIAYQLGTLIAALFGLAWGAATTIIIALVSFYSARKAHAGGKRSMWFLLPTLMFTIVPITMTIWYVFIKEVSWLDRLMSLTPFFVGFAVPLILLLIVYNELRKRLHHP